MILAISLSGCSSKPVAPTPGARKPAHLRDELGTMVYPSTNAEGKWAFGAVYTLAEDPNGMGLLINYSLKVDMAQLRAAPAQLIWNVVDVSKNQFVLPWDPARIISRAQLRTHQISIRDEAQLIALLPAMKELKLVFVAAGDPDRKILYHLDLARLCMENPNYFKNLTNEKKCYEITPNDVARANP
jgi:hypothetical protein